MCTNSIYSVHVLSYLQIPYIQYKLNMELHIQYLQRCTCILTVFSFGTILLTVHISRQPGNSNVVTTWGRILLCRTDNAPFFPQPEVMTISMSGSSQLLNSSDRKAGSPITMVPQGPIFQMLSQTYMYINKMYRKLNLFFTYYKLGNYPL